VEGDVTGLTTAGAAGKTSPTTNGGTLVDDPGAIAGSGNGGGEASQGGGEASQGGGALADAGEASSSGGSAGASSAGSGGTSGSGGSGGSSVGGSTAGGGCGATTCPTGCEPHEYGGHLYAFCSTPLARAEAEAVCETLGFQLVRVDDANEVAWLRGVCFAAVGTNNSSTVWPWLGANDIAVPGEWRWADGTQFWQGTQTGGPVGGLYAHWAQNQPVAKDSCATMQNNPIDSLWSAQPCTSLHPYTCEGN
jgi:hypothetical protein